MWRVGRDLDRIEKAAKEREMELLDAHPEEIVGDSAASRRWQKKLLKNAKKVKFYQCSFNMLSRHAGKGEKSLLKK